MSHPWMPLYLGAYIKNTQRLSTLEHGAYFLLIMEYWQQGSLPDDDKQLAQITRLTEREWKKIRATIQAFFVDGWVHERIEEELSKADGKNVARVQSGRAGGIAKAKREAAKRLANATNLPEQNGSNALASSSQSQLGSNEPNSSLRSERAKPDRKHEFPPNAFEVWYADYPEKVGRGAAESAFEKVRKSDSVSFDDLVQGLRHYRRTKPVDRAWCNPATWLNQKRWADRPASSPTVVSNQGGERTLDLGGEFRTVPVSNVPGIIEIWQTRGFYAPPSPKPGEPGCLIPDEFLPEELRSRGAA